jgi:hypothetical protein
MKFFNPYLSYSLFVLFFIGIFSCNSRVEEGKPYKMAKEERMKEAMDHEIDRTKDPKLGTVPYERLIAAEKYYAKQEQVKGKTSSTLSSIQWSERGPNNVGGRTRAILFLSSTKVLAAGITGGFWLTDNVTAATPTWTPTGDFLSDNINISCIAQDPNTFGTIYAGTGEAFGSAQRGSGIYKSIDNGRTWSSLASTEPGSSNDFTYVARIVVSDDGSVYAACKSRYCNAGGLMKSTNSGTSWSRVVGTYSGGGCSNAVDFKGTDVEENDAGDLFYSTGGSGHVLVSLKATHTTNVGNAGNWTNITPSGTWGRIEMGVSKRTSSSVIYVACQGSSSNDVTGLYYSSNKGSSWTSRTVPTICDQGANSVFTRSQAWYDLVVELDPTNDNTVYIGGIDILKSTNSGAAFTQITTWSGYWTSGGCSGTVPPVVHADQHALVFNPFTSNAALSGNDGGLYYSTTMNNATPSWSSIENGYQTSQFYHLATHPTDNDYVLGGTQDNGSWSLTTSGVGTGSAASGGDGAYSHIHQTSPAYQTTQYVYNNFYKSSNGGTSFAGQSGSNASTGRFINPSDMDDANNSIWSAGSANVLEERTGLTATSLSRATHALSFNGNQLTAIKVSPNNSTTLYVGDDEGYVYKITGRNGTPTIAQTWLLPSSGTGYVSSIDVWKKSTNTDDSILVTQSSYGVNSVYVTGNGTATSPTFTDIDDNSTLQDMPVRWGVFSKEGPDRIFIATDLGVLGTYTINGNSTVWTMVNNGFLPRVRTDALEYDADDNLVAATHGRGIWETTRALCNTLAPILPTTAGTYTSTKAVQEGSNTCFCDANNNLLLVLDTAGTGAVIPANGVSLQIGATATTSWNNSGGIITNTDGGAIINRKWEVSPTTQPSTGNVKVTSYFTDAEYTALVSALGALTSSTTITNSNQLQFYKLTSAGTFADPHASGAAGTVYMHASTPSTTQWTYSAIGSDHSAEYLVSSFSGGGGGGGGGGSPLPVDLLTFTAEAIPLKKANLNWSTGQELNNNYFEILRSYNGLDFEPIGTVDGNSNSINIIEYSYIDATLAESYNLVYYKLNQVDYDGKNALSDVRLVNFKNSNALTIWPIPAKNIVNISSDNRIVNISMYNNTGEEVEVTEKRNGILDVTNYPSGIYFVEITTETGKQVRKLIVD